MNGWLKWVLAGLLAAVLGSYAWSTEIAWRVEDRTFIAVERLEQRLDKRLEKLETLILEQFKRLEKR